MLEVVDISKSYEGKPLLEHISFTVRQNEVACLLGPSGSGKSTLLLIIAGLEPPDAGQIRWNGASLEGLPAHLRDFGLVFQDYALFPHLDVFDNVAFGLRMKGWPREQTQERVQQVLDLVNLGAFAQRRVTDLSGGEQQRVALARALAPRPRLLMFDEPLGALDRALKEDLLEELRHILREARLPAIYVTHDQGEASTIADRVLILHEGRIIRDGSIPEVWADPGSSWTAGFLGLGNILDGKVLDGDRHAETSYGRLSFTCGHAHKPGDRIKLLVRPTQTPAGDPITGRVADVVFQQDRYRVTLDGGLFLYMETAPKNGQAITVRLDVQCLG